MDNQHPSNVYVVGDGGANVSHPYQFLVHNIKQNRPQANKKREEKDNITHSRPLEVQ